MAESDAEWTVIGHYPTSQNRDLPKPGTNHFDINLETAPWFLKPDQVLVENKQVHQPTDHAKHLAVFKKGSLMANTDWKTMETLIFGREVSKAPAAPTPTFQTAVPVAVAAAGADSGSGGVGGVAKANLPITGKFDSTMVGK